MAALPAPLVSTSSFIALLSSFAAVLDEPGLLASRGDENVRIIVEGLLRLGPDAVGTEPIRKTVQNYISTRKIGLSLFGDVESAGQFEDVGFQLLFLLSES